MHKLYADVEGSCTGSYFIICVVQQENITLGKIIPGKGDAEFTITYKAVVWRPFKGETVDGIVKSVNKVGITVEVGPLSVFISTHMIPGEMRFDPTSNPPQFSDGQGDPITKDTVLRLKLVGIRTDIGQIHAIGSIKDDYLGTL